MRMNGTIGSMEPTLESWDHVFLEIVHHPIHFMKSSEAVRSKMAEVKLRMDAADERALEAKRGKKKAQVILIDVGMEIKYLKEELKSTEE
ncbi:hypothetical protein COCNU_09G001460 [Cocos nucifera]|uniref:Uncharacterized protein n=1 Tax=Cocos nucifera TaxID=13894 RepID=A0A8K0IJ71_COCNU|nr:hypothetical protein COCNU_09G001460 [Cocos nucifera]